MAGRNDLVEVTLHPDNSVTVRDSGSGIPVDVMKEQGLPALTVVLTKLHAGGKFGGEGYKVSGGLHGVGVSVVNALSEWLIAEVQARRQDLPRRSSRAASRRREMKTVGPTKETGTTITFLPDSEIFEELDCRRETLVQRLRETAFLTKGLRIVAHRRARGRGAHEFHSRGRHPRLRRATSTRRRTRPQAHRLLRGRANGDAGSGQVEVAMQWNTSYVESVFSFANNINTHEGGSHLSGFNAALTRTLNDYARDNGLLKEKDDNLEGEDVREGLAARHLGQAARAAVRGPDEDEARQPLGPQASSSRRSTLKLAEFLEENADRARSRSSTRRSRPRNARQAARKARELTRRKSALDGIVASGQARRLLDQRPRVGRALPRRGQLGRRLRRRRARPHLPGDPAAARQGDQLGEEPHQQGALEHRDPVDHHRDRHRASATSSTSRSSATTASSS